MSLDPVTHKYCSEYTLTIPIAHIKAHVENASMLADNRALMECESKMVLEHNWLGNIVEIFYLHRYISDMYTITKNSGHIDIIYDPYSVFIFFNFWFAGQCFDRSFIIGHHGNKEKKWS